MWGKESGNSRMYNIEVRGKVIEYRGIPETNISEPDRLSAVTEKQ
jgi:DNA/RNA endonuclease YhcR with UshA esterase domain